MNDYYIYEIAKQDAEGLLQERRAQRWASRIAKGRHRPAPSGRVELARFLRRLANWIEPGAQVRSQAHATTWP